MNELLTWERFGPIIEEYNIGSEGGSAWYWYIKEDGEWGSFGHSGDTQLEAIRKVYAEILIRGLKNQVDDDPISM